MNETRDVVMSGLVLGEGDKAQSDNLEQANQELQRLRARSHRLQAELADALREADVARRRRDWAFSERDKLLQERESVKALCNRLRKVGSYIVMYVVIRHVYVIGNNHCLSHTIWV